MPEYKTVGSAGMDICCAEDFSLAPMERRLVKTGLSIAVPLNFEAQVRPRSGLALKYGISMVNTPGTIDSDYRGEIGIIMINFGSEPVSFAKGDRVAQLVICPILRVVPEATTDLDSTVRGVGGFGSTGV
jgi:dUTP pyrophosphatase